MTSLPKSTSDFVTPEMILAMEQELENIAQLEKEIALAEQAGLDMSAQKAINAEHKQQAMQFLAVYRSKKR